jgi:MFS family permease
MSGTLTTTETAAPDYRAYRTRVAYFLGVFNGVLFAMGSAFVDPSTVLPAFVSRLTDSEAAIGLVSAIAMGGWYLPQLAAASYVHSWPRKRRLYRLATLLRAVGWVGVIATVLLLGGRHLGLVLGCFLIGYSVCTFSDGLSGVAFLEIVAKTVAPNRLGSFFGHRQFWGGLGGAACGLLVRQILASQRLAFPTNYAVLFAIAAACFIPAWVAFCLVNEPAGPVEEARPFLETLRRAPACIHQDATFRRLLSGRMLLGAAGIAFPFYIVYCRRWLQVPEAAVGTYLTAQMIGSMVAVPVWARLNDRSGPRRLLISAAGLSLTVPLIALLTSLLPLGPGVSHRAFAAVFCGLGATGGGSFIGFTNYLFAIAPEERRTTYMGTLNTCFAFTAFLPMLGGLLLEYASFQVLFAVATAFSVAGAVAVWGLPRPVGGEGGQGPGAGGR